MKLPSNMKSIVKQTDLKETGNKPGKIKDREKDLLLTLEQEDNSVNNKMPGSKTLGAKKLLDE